MDELSRIRTLAETDKPAALRELVLGLMRGNRRELRKGYSADNAAHAAIELLSAALPDVRDVFKVDADNREAFKRYLRETGHSDDDLAYLDGHEGDFWEEFADYLVAQEPNTYPTPRPLVTA
jgi:hypothetical protein